MAYNRKMYKIYKILSKTNLYQSIYNYINLQIFLSKFMHLISHFFLYISKMKNESECQRRVKVDYCV